MPKHPKYEVGDLVLFQRYSYTYGRCLGKIVRKRVTRAGTAFYIRALCPGHSRLSLGSRFVRSYEALSPVKV